MNDIQKKADTFGADFQARRKAAGLTTMQVASVMEGSMGGIGIHPTFVAAAENGKYPRMKASTKRRLNEALDRAIDNKRDRATQNAPTKNMDDITKRLGRADRTIEDVSVSLKHDAFDLVLLVLVSIAVGALAVLAYSVMKGV